MKTIHPNTSSGTQSLRLVDWAQPEPDAGEVLVKIHATAIPPPELQWDSAFTSPGGGLGSFPAAMNQEFSGVVESVGARVRTVKVGEAVYGLAYRLGFRTGYGIAPATALALKPRLLNHLQSAVVPMAALGAWQGLLERARLQSGQRVLILGGAGDVGHLAVQLAHWRGAHVITTVASADRNFVRLLGAAEVIDPETSGFADLIHDVDVVFDTVGDETLTRSLRGLKGDGKVVTLATPSTNVAESRIRDACLRLRADGTQLAQIGRLIDAGELRVFIQEVFPQSQAHEACARAQHGHRRGRIALRWLPG